MRDILEGSARALGGRDGGYDRRCRDVHVGAVLALPGFQACERLRRLGMEGTPTGECVALDTIESDDRAEAAQSLFAATPLPDGRSGERALRLSPAGRSMIAR